jgi:hypothetical protein
VLTGFAGAVPTVEMMRKQQTLKGLIVGSREQQQDMVRALEQFGWKPVIDSRYPLEQMPAAFAHQQTGQHFGKIVVALLIGSPSGICGAGGGCRGSACAFFHDLRQGCPRRQGTSWHAGLRAYLHASAQHTRPRRNSAPPWRPAYNAGRRSHA